MFKFVTVAAGFLALPIAAIAAPYCLVIPNGSPQCIYIDGAACAAEAARQTGSCQVNPAEVRVPTARVGEYCLILPSGYSTCGYADGNVCSRDALRQKGACTLSAGGSTVPTPNDFTPNANR